MPREAETGHLAFLRLVPIPLRPWLLGKALVGFGVALFATVLATGTLTLGWLVKAENERDEAVPALIKALKDDAMEVRRNAAAALGKIGDPRAREGLEAALQDQDEWVRQVVADALKKLENPGTQ